jgi:predicted ATPase
MALRRIAVTGGPGGGKTTLWREFARRQPERVLAVPEVATPMLSHLFPAVQDEHERCALQRSIFQVQRDLEAVHGRRLTGGQVLLCDRGTRDGAGYWPAGPDAFFEAMATRVELELERYDAVLFLQTAAAAGLSIAEGNPVRNESLEAAVAIDRRLYSVWSRHPRFHYVGLQPEFETKVALGLAALAAWLS